VLARAKKVLTTPKLREEYDLLGLDLDDDLVGEDHQHHDHQDSASDNEKDSKVDSSKPHDRNGTPTSDSVLSAIASATLAGLLQMMVRTAMMAAVSTFVSRYSIALILVAIMLIFISIRVRQSGGGKKEFSILGATFFGIYLMYYGRLGQSFWTFWIG